MISSLSYRVFSVHCKAFEDMSNWTLILQENLNEVSFWLNQIVSPLQIIIGTIGNVLNIIIFTRRSLRSNSCSIYFLASSINNLFVIYTGLLTRYLSSNWNIDPSESNSVLCKLRIYSVYSSLSVDLWLTVLASIDRFLCSSSKVSYRRLSRIVIARRIVIITSIFIYLLHVHIFVYFKSFENICHVFQRNYRIFFNLFFFLVSCILPIILMTIFGLLMINNIRQSRNRINSQQSNQRLKSNDRQMILMLAIQILVTTVFSVPYSVVNLYVVITLNIFEHSFSELASVIITFTMNLSRILYFSNPIIGFYIYTLTSKKFRFELKRLLSLN